MRENKEQKSIGEQPARFKSFSLGFVVIAVLLAFVAGNRFQTIGDYFFAPYTNKGGANLSQNLDYSSVERVYDLLKQKYDGQLDAQALQDGLNEGLVEAAGDPYTEYLSKEEATEFQADLDGTFSGIGAELGKRKDRVVVIAPIDGAPAQKAGLRAGDQIVAIDDEDSTEFSLDEAVNNIRGEIGTEVKLGLVRDGETLEIKITRAQITVPSVESEVLSNDIGYLKITRFSDDTASLAIDAANNFKAQNIKSVILDLRNNGGGLLSSSVKVAGIWLDNKPVVEEREGDQTKSVLKAGNSPILNGLPLIILINEGSASASEILAGALNDHNVATLMGMKTFGKGSVQELIDLPNGGKLKVTVARWFTPNGKNIDKEGISPEIEVDLTEEDFEANRDPQKQRAIDEHLR